MSCFSALMSCAKAAPRTLEDWAASSSGDSAKARVGARPPGLGMVGFGPRSRGLGKAGSEGAAGLGSCGQFSSLWEKYAWWWLEHQHVPLLQACHVAAGSSVAARALGKICSIMEQLTWTLETTWCS